MRKLITTSLNTLIILFITLFSIIVISADFSFESLSQDKILPADEAFVLSIHKHEEKRIILRWAVKENCFLYKDKFKFLSGSKIVESQKITGDPIGINDIYFGEVDVFFDSVSKEILVDDDIKILQVSYQGCNEKGFCYPVIEKVIDINDLSIL